MRLAFIRIPSMLNWLRKLLALPVAPAPQTKRMNFARALGLAGAVAVKTYLYPIQRPILPAGVVPANTKAPVLAMDEAPGSYGQAYAYAGAVYGGVVSGFPGYPYLAMLATRAEYRAMASSLSTELTREWIVINSTEIDDDVTKKKILALTQKLAEMDVKGIIQRAAEHDCYYGRAQIALSIDDQDKDLPLILSSKTVPKGAQVRLSNIEPLWTTPVTYNAIDPTAPDFYKPSKWFMLGQQIHSSRLLTVVTRELPDLLKPAFNFSGISLSQLAEPYVDNWLRTRQSISDVLYNFRTVVLSTQMGQVLQEGNGDGQDLMNRVAYFNALRSNQGTMVVDKESETLTEINTSLSGLHELQAQAQEQMCAVSRMPAIVLTGISPGGLNASSDSEIRVFYDWIAALQEAFWRAPIETIFKVLQLSMFGEIDPDITFTFQPLYQMTPKELAEIRKSDAEAAGVYIDRGVISAEEQREHLARDPESGYQGLEMMDEALSDSNTAD